jgi:hypothetical protein
MAETYSGEFYCVKCKAKREASGEVHVIPPRRASRERPHWAAPESSLSAA